MAGTDYKPIGVNQNSNIKDDVLTIGDYRFSLTNDSTFINSYLKCFNTSTLMIDSAECSAYGSRIDAFDSKTSKDTIIIWSIEYEYITVLHLYYLKNCKVLKIGELTPLLDCKNCDTKNYPISSIKIFDDKSSIRLEFLKPVEFKDQKINNNSTNKVFIVYNKQDFSSKMP